MTTDDGKRVQLNEDGTWNYIDAPVTDSLEFTCEEVIETKVDKMIGLTALVSLEVLVISNDGGKTGFGILATSTMGIVGLVVQAVVDVIDLLPCVGVKFQALLVCHAEVLAGDSFVQVHDQVQLALSACLESQAQIFAVVRRLLQ